MKPKLPTPQISTVIDRRNKRKLTRADSPVWAMRHANWLSLGNGGYMKPRMLGH